MNSGKWILALTMCAIFAAPALAQDTIALYYDDPATGFQRFGETPGVGGSFEIVVLMHTDAPGCAAEFVMTELHETVPGLFKLNTWKIHDTPLDLGDNAVGEYIMAWGFDGCPMGEVEVVRIMYGETAGLLPNNVVLSLRALDPGDSYPSSFGGHMGYINPLDEKIVLTPEPWSEYGMPDNEELAGAVVLNPNWMPVSAGSASVSEVKSRY